MVTFAAFVALFGALIGGLLSVLASVLAQRVQARSQWFAGPSRSGCSAGRRPARSGLAR